MFINKVFSFDISRLFAAIRLAKKAFGPYKRQIIILTILGFLGGLLEAVGVNALIPLFSFFVDSSDRVGTDFIAVSIQKIFIFLHVPFNLPILLVFICVLFILKALTTLYFNYIRISIKTEYERETMDSLYRETLSANWSYLSKQKIGHLETVIMTDVRQSGGLLENIARTIGVVSEFLMYLFVAINISKTVTLITLVLGGIIFFVFKPLLFKIRRYAARTEELNKEVSRHVNESIGGMKNIKAMGNESAFIDVSSSHFSLLRLLQLKSFTIQNIAVSFIQPISVVFVSLVVAFAYYQTSYNLGALAAIIYLIQKMFANLQSLQSFAQMISGSVPYVQSVLEYEDQAAHFVENIKEKSPESFTFKKEIHLDDVFFAYDGGENVLKNISISIPKGSLIGFIGKSGAGKTTVFDLVLRLFRPVSGKIFLDGVDIENINLYEWRKNIAYVPQDAFLLNDTIRNNIIFYSKDVSEEDIKEAIKLAHIDEFVSNLPEGYNTMVGERGVRLSGGQKQRIAIARALVRRPQILLLDEATSALDVESEAYVQEAIRELKGKVTILVIAHRLSTVAYSDKLVVLENGKIIESGSPKELLKDKETYYARMYNIHS